MSLPADLDLKTIFLSASFPSRDQSPQDYATADAAEISQAILAIARAVISCNGRLVFGGHPTVTPLILTVAKEYLYQGTSSHHDYDPPVTAYQSEVFRGYVSQSISDLFNWHLGRLRWIEGDPSETPAFTESGKLVPGSASRSLLRMRRVMIREANPAAAFFVGGMEGIKEEALLCQEIRPDCQLFFLGGPGGASRRLAAEPQKGLKKRFLEFQDDLMSSRSYPALAQNLMLRLAEY